MLRYLRQTKNIFQEHIDILDFFYSSFLFLSSSLDSLVKTLVDKQKTLMNLKKEIVGDVIILKIVEEIETLISDDKNNSDAKILKKIIHRQ